MSKRVSNSGVKEDILRFPRLSYLDVLSNVPFTPCPKLDTDQTLANLAGKKSLGKV
jgi:hypothetical protein